jgi:hypothetical protein
MDRRERNQVETEMSRIEMTRGMIWVLLTNVADAVIKAKKSLRNPQEILKFLHAQAGTPSHQGVLYWPEMGGETMQHVSLVSRRYLTLLALTLWCAFTPISLAHAEVTRVVVNASGPMGVFKGRQYLWVTAMMEGTVKRENGETGQYRVPVVLMYPDRDPNGLGFVDAVNVSAFHNYKEGEAPGGKRRVLYHGDLIFSDYLRREGFTYMAVQWARIVTYVLGADYGVIEDGRDGDEIVKDAARFLRHPDTLEGALPFRPSAVDRVIGFGLSSTAFFLREVVRSG